MFSVPSRYVPRIQCLGSLDYRPVHPARVFNPFFCLSGFLILAFRLHRPRPACQSLSGFVSLAQFTPYGDSAQQADVSMRTTRRFL